MKPHVYREDAARGANRFVKRQWHHHMKPKIGRIKSSFKEISSILAVYEQELKGTIFPSDYNKVLKSLQTKASSESTKIKNEQEAAKQHFEGLQKRCKVPLSNFPGHHFFLKALPDISSLMELTPKDEKTD